MCSEREDFRSTQIFYRSFLQKDYTTFSSRKNSDVPFLFIANIVKHVLLLSSNVDSSDLAIKRIKGINEEVL